MSLTSPTLDMTKWTNTHPYWTGRAPSQFFTTNVLVANGKLILRQHSLVTNLSQVANPNSNIWIGSACVSLQNSAGYEWLLRGQNQGFQGLHG